MNNKLEAAKKEVDSKQLHEDMSQSIDDIHHSFDKVKQEVNTIIATPPPKEEPPKPAAEDKPAPDAEPPKSDVEMKDESKKEVEEGKDPK